ISSPGVHMDRKVSAMTAVKNAADKITPKLIEQVSYLWVKEKNEGAQLEVVVKNVSFAQLREFMKNISNGIKGVKKVSQRSYQKSTAILDVTSRGSTNDIAEAIVDLNFEGFKVEVKDVNPNRLTVSVTPR
ncbi:MAG: hypothetical protein OEW12_07325, partial [Deltaproteobacteria bacterium]|nr:hypothetical protein [Deltaproteobacteria bacterium]